MRGPAFVRLSWLARSRTNEGPRVCGDVLVDVKTATASDADTDFYVDSGTVTAHARLDTGVGKVLVLVLAR